MSRHGMATLPLDCVETYKGLLETTRLIKACYRPSYRCGGGVIVERAHGRPIYWSFLDLKPTYPKSSPSLSMNLRTL